MVVVADTCSLSRLVQYYLPFDTDGVLVPLLKQQIRNGELIITAAVYDECTFVSKGLIIKTLSFLKEKEFRDRIVHNDKLALDNKFLNLVNNNFVNRTKMNSLDPALQEAQKSSYSQGGDFSLLLCAYTSAKKLEDNIFGEKAYILTEETLADNDNKYFYKIPKCCQLIDAECIDIVSYISSITNGKFKVIIDR